MSQQFGNIHGIRVAPSKVKPTTPTHIAGTRSGNSCGNYERSPGHLADERSTAKRSTGINAEMRNPILAGMPNLSPA